MNCNATERRPTYHFIRSFKWVLSERWKHMFLSMFGQCHQWYRNVNCLFVNLRKQEVKTSKADNLHQRKTAVISSPKMDYRRLCGWCSVIGIWILLMVTQVDCVKGKNIYNSVQPEIFFEILDEYCYLKFKCIILCCVIIVGYNDCRTKTSLITYECYIALSSATSSGIKMFC